MYRSIEFLLCIVYTEKKILNLERRGGTALAAISREDIDISALHKYRICSRRFVSDGLADLYNQTNSAWLPTLNLRHEKHGDSTSATSTSVAVERWKRAQEREKWKQIDKLLLAVVTNEINFVINKEHESIAIELIETAMEYFTPPPVYPTSCECSSKINGLEKELAESKDQVLTLTKQIELQIPFCEENFASDDFTKFYTGLPNIKAVFEHVSKMLPTSGITKLSPFQEFICVLLKLRLNSLIEDLVHCFGISTSTVSRIFLKWLKQMDTRMRNLIWPDRDAL